MNQKLQEALNNVELSYSELVEIANSILLPIIGPANDLVAEINAKVHNLSIDSLRDYILAVQLKAFDLSEIKEKSSLKADLAAAVQKEQFAIYFNRADGSAAVKEKQATIDSSSETTASVLYNLMANLLKTKLDQLHRLTDCLKSVLMSRMQETKFMNIGTTSDIPATGGRQILNESRF